MNEVGPPLGAKLLSIEGMEHIRKTIDGIFLLIDQIVDEIEDLKVRVEQIETREAGGEPAEG